ncbi:hypothetical protein [Epilithonimonas hominis]|uniref:hypothetical protein n=1 Tax=Epilithonimonas hominis TaxID=420404 RepID=UPI00289C4133|nr:hypothetical protein [Epilithonimonas hominis]
MRNYFKIISSTIPVILILLIGCQSNKKLNDINKEINYVFFLHNKFLEDNPDGTFESKYNVKVQYAEILKSFRKDGFMVFSLVNMGETEV